MLATLLCLCTPNKASLGAQYLQAAAPRMTCILLPSVGHAMKPIEKILIHPSLKLELYDTDTQQRKCALTYTYESKIKENASIYIACDFHQNCAIIFLCVSFDIRLIKTLTGYQHSGYTAHFSGTCIQPTSSTSCTGDSLC
jgi:hypothetical protein